MRRLILSVVLLLAVLGFGCRSDGMPTDPAGKVYRVLFVGNSLTSANDLPRLLALLAAQDGVRMEYQLIVADGTNLEDHWQSGAVPSALGARAWDYVVMQQGPSTLPASQQHLAHWVTVYSDAARTHGITPAVYMVWPPASTSLALSITSYTNAAQAGNALLLPAGLAWQEAFAASPGIALYGADAFHPSALGTYLAAVTMNARLFRNDEVSVPTSLRGTTLSIDTTTARILRQAAEAALAASSGSRR